MQKLLKGTVPPDYIELKVRWLIKVGHCPHS